MEKLPVIMFAYLVFVQIIVSIKMNPNADFSFLILGRIYVLKLTDIALMYIEF